MANQYTLTDDFSAITETQGTLYNVGDSNIELASAADTTPGQGILFPSGARQTFRGTLYARSMDDAATLNVSDFTEGAGGGDMPVLRFCGSVATYDDLPDDAEQGDVYNVEAADPDHGILAGDNVAWDGTAWDRMAGVYTVMTGASASTDGAAGLAPQPLQGDEAKFLRGDGTWTQEAVMVGATNATDGEKGLVPKPITGEEGKFLRGDGTFAHEATMTGATSSVAGAGGLVPAPAAGDDTKFLSGDGTYKQEAVYTGATAGAAGVKGLVPPASLGDLLSFLRSDGTWANEPTMVGATASTAGVAGLVPAPAAGDSLKSLRGDGSFVSVGYKRRTRKAFTLADLEAAVASGDYAAYDIAPGDYYEGVSGYTYIFAGDNPMKGPIANYTILGNHAGLIVDTHKTSKWNTTSTTTGGYVASALHAYLVNTVLPNVNADLGASHLIAHNKMYSTSVDSSLYNRFGNSTGATDNAAWSSAQYISALSEMQVYGSIVWSSSGRDTGEAGQKLDVFTRYKYAEIFGEETFWLRDIASAGGAAAASYGGNAAYDGAVGEFYVVGLICFH
jgi:hypothetical protein